MRVSSAAEPPPLETVKQVELNRYLGLWYEIGSLPQWFQRDCFGTTAEYSMRDDGKIKVINTCFKGSLEGRKSVAKGKAWSVDPSNAKLKVQFFWPFRGDYWIIELGDNYEYAVVGAPNRKYLWILARTPRIDETLYNQLLETIKTKHHYDLSKFQKSVQR
jgi:apolipoprotein D and lipocalin family protein